MNDNSTLNIIISLIFTYLLYSLLATALQESISGLFHRRADTLYKGIKVMLTDRDLSLSWMERFELNIMQKSEKVLSYIVGLFETKKAVTLHDRFYHHPIIKNYGESNTSRKPSYISSKNFAAIMIDTIKNLNQSETGAPITLPTLRKIINDYTINNPTKTSTVEKENRVVPCETSKILLYHLDHSGGDMNVFSNRLEEWYNDTMDRVSGWYKRSTQATLFFLGLWLAFSFNIDSIAIAQHLSQNKIIAEKIAGIAAAKITSSDADVNLEKQKKILEDIKNNKDLVNNSLGLGWKDSSGKELRRNEFSSYIKLIWVQLTWTKATGFFITAIAIGLGAPFWFDLLNKFVNLRAAGKAINPSGSSISNTGNDIIDG